MDMRSLPKICGVSLPDRIRNEAIHTKAGNSEDVTVRMRYGAKLSKVRSDDYFSNMKFFIKFALRCIAQTAG